MNKSLIRQTLWKGHGPNDPNGPVFPNVGYLKNNEGLYKKNFSSARPKRIVVKVVLYQGQKMLKAVGLEKSLSDTESRDIESYIDR